MPEEERTFHIMTELASVLFVSPYLWTHGDRTMKFIAIAGILIDGYLVGRWFGWW